MVNIGTLAAFTLVSIAVPILRKRRPDLKRSFKVPLNPVLPILSAVVCVYLMLNLSVETWIRFVIWMLLGFIVYFAYSRYRSRLAVGAVEPTGRARRGGVPHLTPAPAVRRHPAAHLGRRGVVRTTRGAQRVLTLLTTLVSDSLASPKSSIVRGSWSSSFSMPANPGASSGLRPSRWSSQARCAPD